MRYLLTLTLVLTACGSDTFNTDDASTPASSDGGGDAGSTLPPGCDPTKDPKDSPACVADGVGLFVSVNGADTNPGTKESPLLTLDAALGKMPSRIYVCAGDYSSGATIKAPVGIFGGFDCGTWAYDGTRPRIKGNLAVKATSNVSLVDLEIDAPDRDSKTGLSSVALVVGGSQMVVLRRMKLVAGNGGSGADGTLTQFMFPAPLKGSDGMSSSAPAVTQMCPDKSISVGGKGAHYPNNGDNGTPGAKANGGTYAQCDGSGIGGGNGDPGGPGGAAAGAVQLGALSPDGWLPQPGGDGQPGKPGQGGGGASAGATTANYGSGGGAGGCGGAGGGGGQGGGASVGLAVVASDVMIRESTITSRNGGAGGNGVGGQPGQAFAGGPGAATPPACVGGIGGFGGNGGSGGGGAGGVSIALFFKGTLPDVDGVTQASLMVGNFGTKGLGGTATGDGIDGVAVATYECKAPMCQ